MNAQSMTVDPNELVIDMPVNEKLVVEYMASMAEHGLIQPVTVRLQDNRIIDGFHRAVAASRLGWKEIVAYVVDCNDEAFWNARIISARQHHEVEDERLAAWIFECWRQTRWFVSVKPDKDGLLPRAYSNTSLDMTLLEMTWSVFNKKRYGSTFSLNAPLLTQDEIELSRWMDDRASQWGLTAEKIASSVLSQCGIKSGFTDKDRSFDQFAHKYNLDFRETLRLQKEMPEEYPYYHQSAGYVRYLTEAGADAADTFSDYLVKENHAEQVRMRRADEERAAKRSVAVVEHIPTQRQADEGAAKYNAQKSAREKRQHAIDMLKEMRNWVRSLEPSLRQLEDGQSIFAAFVTDMASTHERLWPTVPTGHETVDLHNQIDTLKEQLESLRRALDTKRRTAVTSNHVAIPSSEVKRLPS